MILLLKKPLIVFVSVLELKIIHRNNHCSEVTHECIKVFLLLTIHAESQSSGSESEFLSYAIPFCDLYNDF